MGSRFVVGDAVQVYKPGHAEHGMHSIVGKVLTIEEYGGPSSRGPHAYRAKDGWTHSERPWTFPGTLPDAMVVSYSAEQDGGEVE